MNSAFNEPLSADRSKLAIVILGGGTAGWMTAAALAKIMRGRHRIELVESDEIGRVGVGEATIPHLRTYNDLLGVDENEFMSNTQSTFKLGIEFVDWGNLGTSYIHGFGRIGQDLWTMAFDQYWRRMLPTGKAGELGDYSINVVAARQNKFMRSPSDITNSPLNDLVYAFHLDASLYAAYLRRYAEARGITRSEGKVVNVERDPESGNIRCLQLADGSKIHGDLFLDCSGFQSLLLGKTLGVKFESWAHWLPCDAAVAVPSSGGGALTPYTRSTARPHGWQWRIPLQQRMGNGYVFSTKHVSADEATSVLLKNIEGKPLAEPRVVRFEAGMRRVAWSHNCIAIGLSGGFLEPLESTSIHLIQTMIARLFAFFPDRGFAEREVKEFNRQVCTDYERIRDFIILHYYATQRSDSDFWNACRTMEIPDSLKERIAMYRLHGRLFRDGNELFAEPSWLQVLEGQGIRAESYHPLADLPEESVLTDYLNNVRQLIARCVNAMPDHAQYVMQQCASPLERV
ncbi:MAG: tryptophan halogenase family protein [Steroidobacter sp.]